MTVILFSYLFEKDKLIKLALAAWYVKKTKFVKKNSKLIKKGNKIMTTLLAAAAVFVIEREREF